MSREAAVRQAAAALVAAFASNDTEGYFACFSADASFVFHTLPQPLLSRSAYQALWQEWQGQGFAVLSCHSSNAQVALHGDTAIFIHEVATHLRLEGQEHRLQERETIVFRRVAERWLACHEHLSAVSAPA
jgi:uncharacterized protein (TIGR02246 family)